MQAQPSSYKLPKGLKYIDHPRNFLGLAITTHFGPLARDHPSYRGSRYILEVEWSAGHSTYEPLNKIFKLKPYIVALYGFENNLLTTYGWRQCQLLLYSNPRIHISDEREITFLKDKDLEMESMQYMFSYNGIELDENGISTPYNDLPYTDPPTLGPFPTHIGPPRPPPAPRSQALVYYRSTHDYASAILVSALTEPLYVATDPIPPTGVILADDYSEQNSQKEKVKEELATHFCMCAFGLDNTTYDDVFVDNYLATSPAYSATMSTYSPRSPTYSPTSPPYSLEYTYSSQAKLPSVIPPSSIVVAHNEQHFLLAQAPTNDDDMMDDVSGEYHMRVDHMNLSDDDITSDPNAPRIVNHTTHSHDHDSEHHSTVSSFASDDTDTINDNWHPNLQSYSDKIALLSQGLSITIEEHPRIPYYQLSKMHSIHIQDALTNLKWGLDELERAQRALHSAMAIAKKKAAIESYHDDQSDHDSASWLN